MENKVEKIICPACGSDQVETHAEDRQLNFPYAGLMAFRETMNHCNVCGVDGDFGQSNETAIAAVEEQAKKISIEAMMSYLNEQGNSMAYMERALDLPQRTMVRWKTGECSSSSLALLRMVRTLPWLLKVSEARFDPISTMQIVFSEGVKLVGPLVAAMHPSARFDVSVNSQHPSELEVVTRLSLNDQNKQIDYSEYQEIRLAGSRS